MKRIKKKVKNGPGRSKAMSTEQRIRRLSGFATGRTNYFNLTDMKKYCQELIQALQIMDELLERPER